MTESKGAPVVVTTEHRGVFFGYLQDDGTEPGTTVTITDAQMCVYWSTDVRGIVGLAATGPTSGCKITPAAPSITLHGVTAVMGATDEAVIAWQKRPWR